MMGDAALIILAVLGGMSLFLFVLFAGFYALASWAEKRREEK